MLGRDVDSKPIQYRTWVSSYPDFNVYNYHGYKSGSNEFVDVSGYLIYDEDLVVDFSLPLPTDWEITYCLLPQEICNSQLTVIDGYVYLFGGRLTNKIFRAPLSDPGVWEDTGETLPVPLYASQIAIVDGYIYLFGGSGDGYAIDNIYRAPLSNPLSWVDTGEVLPNPLYGSQLCILDDNLYLFGGHDLYGTSDVIFTATALDPLTWITAGTISASTYGAHVAIIEDKLYLFGGANDTSQLDIIQSADTIDPLTWSTSSSVLPYDFSYGQFITIGSKGYLFGGSHSGVESNGKILRCDLLDPLTWIEVLNDDDIAKVIPGVIYESQAAIISDRIFIFGGNGSQLIFACKQSFRYDFSGDDAVEYGDVTRTQYNAASSELELFKVLGFPYWKTDYIYDPDE